jgi:hypothetical protein
MKIIPLLQSQAIPSLDISLVVGKRFVLGEAPAERFDMRLFYRGLHYPICAKQLKEFDEFSSEFKGRGVNIISISTDWGLYLSESLEKKSVGIDEPKLYSEPALYLIKPDTTLYYAAVQTMPFARPSTPDLLAVIDYSIKEQYPARGDYLGPV